MRKSAEQGLAAGQVGMGALYENGAGVPPDPVEAMNWYRLAVQQNDPNAMNNLALLLATSKNPHVRNPQEAVSLATRAVAAANNPDYLDTLAAAYFSNGQTDKAIETEQKALAMNPANDSYKESLQKYLAANGGR
jgi:TPR repeat protein